MVQVVVGVRREGARRVSWLRLLLRELGCLGGRYEVGENWVPGQEGGEELMCYTTTTHTIIVASRTARVSVPRYIFNLYTSVI